MSHAHVRYKGVFSASWKEGKEMVDESVLFDGSISEIDCRVRGDGGLRLKLCNERWYGARKLVGDIYGSWLSHLVSSLFLCIIFVSSGMC